MEILGATTDLFKLWNDMKCAKSDPSSLARELKGEAKVALAGRPGITFRPVDSEPPPFQWPPPGVAQRYQPSPRAYAGLPSSTTPFHDKTVMVTTCGRICFNRQKINLSQVFAGQMVGIKQVDERIWLASFMHYDLGYFDDETARLEPLQNPFGPKVLPMSPV